ncbi:MAG: ribokinase [Candidatus Rokubacteria bacterium]|nr:ribokinase [Candidatus Rokubacteria bacterium]
MSRVLVVGSANVDYTVAAARLPRPGETVSGGTLLVNHGGKGANQAVAARRLGAEVRFVGCVGDDAAGRDTRAALAGEGIDVGGLAVAAGGATGTALIVVDAEGRNQIAVAPGANRALGVEHVTARRDDFAWADVVVGQLETPLATVRTTLELARRHHAITILNPAPVPDAPLDVWSLVDYLTPNVGEAERLSGVPVTSSAGAAAAAVALRRRGVGAVIVTLGGEGALAVTSEGELSVPARAVTVVDTTAAGDAFNGALAVALAEGRGLRDAVEFANAAAALACTRRGAQPSLPARAEVERLLAG